MSRERPPDDKVPERFDRRRTHFVAATDRERQAVTLERTSVFRMTYAAE